MLQTGAVQIKIPKYIWKDWNGDWTGTNNLTANIPVYPNKRSGMYFSYIDGKNAGNYSFLQNDSNAEDYYYLINSQPVSGGTGLDFTISYSAYAYSIPGGAENYADAVMEYIDGYEYYQGEVPVTVTIDTDFNVDDGGTYEADMTDRVTLTNEMHTYVTPKASLSSKSVSYTWNDSWGTKPVDADDYFYVTWGWSNSTQSNTMFSNIWTENTIHDGTVVGWGSSSLTENDTVHNFNYSSNGSNTVYVVIKYPKVLLEGMPDSGLTLKNAAISKTIWKSGYVQEQYVEGKITIQDTAPYTDSFKKTHGSSSARTVSGGNEDLVYDNKPVSMQWSLTYDGDARETPVTWDENTKTYHAAKRVIELVDGKSGDVMYSSGNASSRYVWSPETGNVSLYDNDYTVTNLTIALTEYDAVCSNGLWSGRLTHNNVADYSGVDVYVRYANSNEWTYFKTVSKTSGSNISVTLPSDVAGYKILHETDFYSTYISVSGSFKINPTSHVNSLVSSDMDMNKTSIFKDQSECSIWEKENADVFHYSNNSGGDTSAAQVCYELTKSNHYQYTFMSSANQGSVIFDAVKGIQDNRTVISGWNYNTSSSRVTPVTSGIFYDLLPVGTSVNVDTMNGYYTTGNYSQSSAPSVGTQLPKELYHVRFKENWENSNRTMMIIECNAPDGVKITGFVFSYMLRNTYENIIENGTSVENDVAFINTTSTRMTPYGKSGALSTVTDQEYYKTLDDENKEFITYAKSSAQYIPIDAFSWGFSKSVLSDSTGGAYVNENAMTFPNSEYTYRLEFNQSDSAKSSNIIFYDILEYGADKVSDDGHEFVSSGWHGTLKNVNIAGIADKNSNGSTSIKCSPVVYYATKDRSSFTDSDYDISNHDVWTATEPEDLSTVTAIAVDCSKASDGSDFIFKNEDSLSVYVTMTAPNDSNGFDKKTYNTAVVYAEQGGSGIITSMESDSELTLKDIVPELHKSSTPEGGTSENPVKVFMDTTIEYKLSIVNTNSVLQMKDIVVEDTIPKGLVLDFENMKFVLDDSAGELVSNSPLISVSKDGRKLTFTIKRLAAGQTGHILIPSVVGVETGMISNTAEIVSVNGIDKSFLSGTIYHEAVPVPEEGTKVRVRKINKNGDLIAGAKLQITGRGIYDSEDIKPVEWITEEDKVFETELEPGNYVLHEVEAPDGYVVNPFDIAFEVKDTDVELEMFDSEETEFQISKSWNDGNDEDGRPDSVTFEIYQDGKYLKNATVNKADDWKLSVSGLPKYSNDGKHEVCVYTVKEIFDGYEASYVYGTDMEHQSVHVTNTKTADVKGQKIWNDNEDASRPDTITVKLLQNGLEYAAKEVTSANSWKYRFEGIPLYDKDGSEFTYSVKETYMEGYAVSYTASECEGVAVSLDYQTESTSYDWFYVYYYKDGKLYRSDKYGGSTRKQVTLNIPSPEFWLEFRSDGSSCGYYGVKVTDVKQLDSAPPVLGTTVSAMSGGYNEIEASDWSEIETLPHGNYGNNVQKRWHYIASDAGKNVDITNTKLSSDYTKVQFEKLDDAGESVTNAHLQLIDSKGNVIQDWITENTAEVFNGIDPGDYVLHEVAAPEGYRLASDMNINIKDTFEMQTFTMVDKIDKGVNLSVSKTVTGSGGNKCKDFHFSLQLTGGDSYPDELQYIVTQDGENDITGFMPMKEGTGNFVLAHGQTIAFSEVPGNLHYEISELDGGSEGYTVTYINRDGILEEDTFVDVINKKNQVVPSSADTNVRRFFLITMIALAALLLEGMKYKNLYNRKKRKRR